MKIAVVAAVVVLIGAFQLSRPGYSVDEEFTIFAVRGIAAHGVPVLPSGLLYDRGLAYSYASWLVSVLPGDDLVAARALSLLSVAVTLVLLFVFLEPLFGSERFAILATVAAASSISLWAAATTARFYGPFLLTYVAAMLCIQRRSWAALCVVAMLSRWTHELAFTMLAIPALGLLLAEREERGRWLKTGVAIGFGLLVAQFLILALHYAVPSSGETMIRRFFVWQVVNLFQRPPDRQFAIPLVVMVIAWLLAPKRAFLSTAIALCGAAFIIGMSRGVAGGSRYPLDMFWSLVHAAPLLTLVTLGALVGRVIGLGGEWPLIERAFHFMWIGWVIWFGIIESGITLNYQLLPITLMTLAVAVDLHAVARERKISFVAVSLLLIVICGNQWGGRWPGDTLAAERPTIHVEGIEAIRDGLQPNDRVACTDELACLLLVGRDDAWLALDDFVRERFVVRKAGDSMVGVYGGAPAVFRPSDLLGELGTGKTPERVVIVDVFKEYPVGNSRTWLPRALALDGIEGKVLLETPQARVVQISAPIRNAQVIP